MQAFLLSTGIVALGERGDKTQIATVALAARHGSLLAVVVVGTRLGMMRAKLPAVDRGDTIARRVSMALKHGVAALIFAVLGGLTLNAPPPPAPLPASPPSQKACPGLGSPTLPAPAVPAATACRR